MNPSGLRIGTPALTTRGLVEDDMREIAAVIAARPSERISRREKASLAERTRCADGPLPALPAALSSLRLTTTRTPEA